MLAAIADTEAQLEGCQADLRACEEALKLRTDELVACRSERDALLAALKKFRCSLVTSVTCQDSDPMLAFLRHKQR